MLDDSKSCKTCTHYGPWSGACYKKTESNFKSGSAKDYHMQVSCLCNDIKARKLLKLLTEALPFSIIFIMDQQLIKELARKAGLQSYYAAQEEAIHKFAELLWKEAYQTGRDDGYEEAIIKERGGC